MYEVDDRLVAADVAALPPELLIPYAELRAVLETAPSDVGRPMNSRRPEGMRTVAIGPDDRLLVTFGVLGGEQREVVIYQMVVY